MEMKELKIGDMIAKYPIIQGGMGVGVSRWRLASAVAREGGIGVISTAQIGYDEPEFESNPIETNLQALKKHISLAKEHSEGGIVGVNIMVATRQYESYVMAACEAGVDLIISGAGLPMTLPQLVNGYDTKIIPIVSSVKASSVILKQWDRKYNRTADGIIVEGPRAGGHLGFTKEQVEQYDENEFAEEIKLIIEYKKEFEEKYNTKIPVIVAGGIFDQQDIMKILSLGADGVQIATRFVTTEECDASDAFKQAYINATKEDIRIVASPVGMPGRAIMTPFLQRVSEGRIPVSRCYQCIGKCNPSEIPYCITKALVEAVKGNIDEGLIFCGDNVNRLNEITTVKDIFKELIS